MALEKRWAVVPVQSLAADGTSDGLITIPDAFAYRVRQPIFLKSNTQATLILQVKSVTSSTTLYVGSPGKDMNDRTNVSAYLLVDGASVASLDANILDRPSLGPDVYQRAVYEEEPVVAVRTFLVNRGGDPLGSDPSSPLYVSGGGGGGGGGGDGAIIDGANPTIRATVTAAKALKVDGSAVTQPISDSAGNTKLDTLHADLGTIEGKQDTGNASVASVDGKLPTLMSAAPGSDTGQPAVPVRIISQLGAGGGGGGGLTDTQLRASPVPVSGPLTDTQLRASNVPVSGPLTDTQLRAAAVPVSGTFFQPTQPVSIASMPSTPVTGTFFQPTQPVSIASMPTTPVTLAAGPTAIAKAEDSPSADADVGVPAMAIQKATPADTAGTDGDYAMLQMSGGRLWISSKIDSALPAGANVIGHVIVDSAPTTAVTGPLTDTQLRASAVPVSGTFFQPTQPVSIASMPSTPVTGPLTDTQLRASAVPVSGTFFQPTQPVSIASMPTTPVTLAAGAAAIAKAEDSPSADADVGVPSMAIQKAAPADTAGTDGDYAMLQMSGGRLWASSKIDTALPAGTNVIGHVIVDSAPTTAVTGPLTDTQLRASAVPVSLATLPALAVGSAVVGKVGIDQTTPGTSNGVQVVAALPAGSAVIGKTGIDQTTPGTTNGVQVVAAIPAGSNTIGKTDQGAAAAVAAAWPTKVTDGTNTAAVKAASTLPAATDPALVVTLRDTTTIQGNQGSRSTANITSAVSVVGPFSCSNLNVATITISGTYNSVSFVFEATDDGTNWYSIQAVRNDSGIIETGGTLLTNTTRSWDTAVGGFTQIRVRATAWTSGTAAIGLTMQAMPYEPTPAISLSTINGVAVVTAAAGVQKTGVSGNAGAAMDAADNAAAPANGMVASGIYSTTIPALTSGNAAQVRLDSTGAQQVNTEGRKQTFSCALIDFAPIASSTAPSVSIQGSASKTVRITRIGISGTAATGGLLTLILKRFSALATGTSASQSAVIAKHDTNNATATAVVSTWSVAATPTAAGQIRTAAIELPTPAVTVQPVLYEWTFGDKNGQGLVLRGTADFVGLCFSAIATTPKTEIYIEWTEE